MCGVAGVFAYADSAPAVDRDELIGMRDQMQSRGPDGEGLWMSECGRAGLAHRRLTIIDLSDASAQPMFDDATGVGVAFNGEIYNFASLRETLEAKGHVFRSSGDTEVLLAAYLEHGVEALPLLEGMFAFALWDPRRRAMLLARDTFGIKPLYYACSGGAVRFASQVRALLASPAVAREPDPAGWVGFYSWGSVPEPLTTHRDIRAIPAGSYQWIDHRGLGAPVSYRDVPSLWQASSPSARTERADTVRAACVDSVRRHLVADVPVGVFLSAGVDSGVIAGLAARATEGRLKTVTLAFEEFRGTPSDEAPIAEAAARLIGAEHQTVNLDHRTLGRQLDGFLAAMDQPTIDGLNSFLVNRAAALVGLRVVLSGVGGDEVFAGYPSFRSVPIAWAAGKIARRLPVRAVVAALHRRLPLGRREPKIRFVLENVRTVGAAYFAQRGLFMPWEIPQLLDAELGQIGLQHYDPVAHAMRFCGVRGVGPQISVLEQSLYMRNQLLRDLDWASMAHSVEARVPFVDVDLVRRSATAVGRLSWTRSDKDALRRLLSPEHAALLEGRSKTGFSVPMDQLAALTGKPPPGEHWSRHWARYCGARFWDRYHRS